MTWTISFGSSMRNIKQISRKESTNGSTKRGRRLDINVGAYKAGMGRYPDPSEHTTLSFVCTPNRLVTIEIMQLIQCKPCEIMVY
jgi:hypothetical protein